MEKFEQCISKTLKAELVRLRDSKARRDNQRYEMIQSGILKALVNPKKTDNIIHGLKPYWAEKVGGQIRLFYEIIEASNIVHFVWVNPEEFPHNTNDGQENDPCYNEFTRLYNKQAFDKYVQEVAPAKDVYSQSAKWLSEQIYATLKSNSGFSQCSMQLEEVSEKTYRILGIYSSSYIDSLERKLLSCVLDSAKPFRLSFLYDLYLGSSKETEDAIRKALLENSFKLKEKSEDLEVWHFDSP